MIDFIEYVVTELTSKRLSKANAVALVKQFSRGSAKGTGTAVLHPLLHRNSSDLHEQRFTSTFTGQEFFLDDHQVAPNGQAGRRVLPGVAYLEMARAAIEQAWPERPNDALLELRHVVWAQPIVVEGRKDVHIALIANDPANDDDRVEFEIYTESDGEDVIHCQGVAMPGGAGVPAAIDVAQLKARMTRERLTAAGVYATFRRMGLLYGPAFQAISEIHAGDGEVIAELRLPESTAGSATEYVLHPSLMDSASQAAIGLLESGSDVPQPRLPFALETLRVVAPCTPKMFAWLRYAAGSQSSNNVVKVDIDLCDEHGNVCVEMRGFSWRILSGELAVSAGDRHPAGTLLAVPSWQESAIEAGGHDYAEHHLLSLREVRHEQYLEYALACFERVQAMLRGKPQGKVLLQVVAGDAVFAGLSALLKTASLENPQFAGQVILVPAEMTPEEVSRLLEQEWRGVLDPIVKYGNGARQVLQWQELAAPRDDATLAFKENGIYLITGGRGGLGTLFANEILGRTRGARVVLAGRSPLPMGTGTDRDADPRRIHRQADVSNLEDVRNLIASIRGEYGRLDGILHGAGVIADNFILRKDEAEFLQVLAPKVTGTLNLDEATKDVDLDFFVLFSAIGAATGNIGQADYAAANGFLDHFAAHRNREVADGRRRGRTRSIDWPLWQAGGMGVDATTRERLQQTTGMQPMQTATGMAAFHRALELPHDQLLVVEGDLARIRRAVLAAPIPAADRPVVPEPVAAGADAELLAERTQHYLRKQFAELLKLPFEKVDPRAALENYGMDSILAMKLTSEMESAFGSLPKTLFFEYQTIRELAGYFLEQHSAQLIALFAPAAPRQSGALQPQPAALAKTASKTASKRRSRRRQPAAAPRAKHDEPIAIIGLSGRYPQSVDLDAYWKNLRDGKDCITEVPKERWDWREYYAEDRTASGRHFSKWGGFIQGVDEFDPLFFNLSPVEAEGIDPQERLFLLHAWMAVEDAAYTRARLQVPYEDDLAGQVGVYAGVMYTEYQLFGAEATARGQRLGVASSGASVANRVSYLLNLHGPSMTVDTMCSSSLTAIHLACQDLKLGRTSLAIAGGVNVSIHPNKYLILSAGQFISSDGHCQSFGEGGDGYIPGEGVGVVVLKRLSEAERDGDHIYGVIRGTALNHGGKTNGYSVPSPQAQASAVRRALAESGVDARHISYVEAHGTGTKLGDPIEIAALSKAFGRYTAETGFARIGSAKSNIGHCESAAGVAGLTKVLLQMQHRQIVPSLHSEQLNPHIDFESTPFIVNQTLQPWEQPVIDGRTIPRIAGISSFGAGGSNAHVLVEEYQAPVRQAAALASTAVVLSARMPEQLRQKVRELLEFIEPRRTAIDLTSMAYTLQTGREAMEERLGFVVTSMDELVEKLQVWLAGGQGIEQSWQGSVKRGNDWLSLFSTDADLQQTVGRWIAANRLSRVLELWVKGLELDWIQLYGEQRPQSITLPTYPFARERYWIDVTAGAPAAIEGAATAVLHPLLHSNTSDLSEQRYRSTFTGDEFFLADHRVQEEKVLPGVAYLEMARAAVERALPERPEAAVLDLRNVVWVQPLVVRDATEVHIALTPADDGRVDYEIYSGDVVHGQGSALLSSEPAPDRLDLDRLTAQMSGGRSTPDAVYSALARMGLTHGASLRAITAIHRGPGQVVAELTLPRMVESADYVLHPSLMDSALQAAAALAGDPSELGEEARVPFALQSLRLFRPCTTSMVAWVRYAAGPENVDTDVDIDLCDVSGNVCVQMRGLTSRSMSRSEDAGSVVAAPIWRAKPIERWSSALEPEERLEERHVILCDLPGVDVEQLGALLSLSACLSLCTEEDCEVAQRYSDYAVDCFQQVQAILQSKPEGNVLVQIVANNPLFAGLSALLKTAALENPRFIGQLILVPAGITADELCARLDEEIGGPDTLIRLRDNVREILAWQEIAEYRDRMAFKDDGVYLITGGRGALGGIFAAEILERTAGSHVVLTGRSASSGDAHPSPRQSYRQADLGNLDQVRQLVESIRSEYGRLDGVLHSAGMIADNFILGKESEEFRRVLAPKVTGTMNLDEATRDVALDFFVLFSSVAGATGNAGQADYAVANAFMDHFAAYRNRQVAARQRHGRTRSINWPLWQAGGMSIDAASREMMQRATGMRAMRTETGLQAFHRSLASPYDQTLVVEGDVARIRRALFAAPATPPGAEARPPAAMTEPAAAGLAGKTQDYLRREFSELLKLPFPKIDPQAPLENYGIDSVLAMRLTNQLEKTFGSLSKTLFFEYQTIAALGEYFMKAYPAVLQEKLGLSVTKTTEVAPSTVAMAPPAPARRSRNRFLSPSPSLRPEAVAIVGVSGRYPEADNLTEFWRNLQNGRDCITEIPADRWDYRLWFDPDRNKAGTSYSKWGGFMADVDKFDPLFFNMSPKEAELVDPQERLFLETAWETIEDAGYTKESIAGGRIGVYVGAMWNHYELFGAESLSRGSAGLPTSSHASIANRVSYFFDFHGPSIGLDTMCSSSLTAIHLACEALWRGEIDAAVAGGVNVTIHPYKHLTLSQGKFAASDGRCRSFGAGGDGYVPGEGVGAVLLKPLEQARRDGDQIYAVIRSTSVNHGGKTNGYTVPNPNAQAELIAEALRKGGVDPKTLSYVETHGTGTSLGDPIEITGLSKAFEGSTDQKQFVPIGSVKSNIGHLESAAGIAAVTKALLQIKYNQLVPSLHADPLNPNIDFASTPFYVQTELSEWKRTGALPRRIGVSSFGAGGSNAHLILEEFEDARPDLAASAMPQAFVLAAKNPEALRRYAERVVRFLEDGCGDSLASIAFTSQVGRTPMDARLAVVASTVEELREKLDGWLGSRPDLEGVFSGYLKDVQDSAGALITGPSGKAFLEALLTNQELEKIARLWVAGAAIDWPVLYRHGAPRKVSLPTYPFARERCWITQQAPSPRVLQPAPSLPESRPAEVRRRMDYQPQWTPQALPRTGTGPAAGPILILDDSDALSLALGADSVILAKPGQALDGLIDELARNGRLPGVVIHHAPQPCNLDDEQDVARQLNQGVMALFDLCKALKKHAGPRRIISLFSGPLGSAIGGFFRTLTLEDPAWLAKAIEVEAGLSISSTVALLRNELADPDWLAQEVRYQGDARLVRALVPLAEPRSASPLPVKKNGVYLITGGMGGLGMIFAEHLAKTSQARLALIGRSAPNAKQQARLEQLESYGAELLVLSADVTNAADMERVVRETKARFSRIDGVIHAAGVNRDAFIVRKSREEMQAVLAPKIYGTINVDRATRAEELDFFVLFSSVAAVTGNIGQSDYAFANRFLDAFAEQRASSLRPGLTLSINWPLWEEGGMTIPPDQLALLEQQTGMSPLPSREGIQCWEDFLRTGAVQLLPLYGDTARISAFLARQPVRRAQASVPSVDANSLFASTEDYLKACIGEEIKLEAGRIGSSDPLESFGIDSVMINRINARFERDLGPLPKTLLYEQETVRALAVYLVRETRDALVALFASAPVGSGGPDVEPALPAAVEAVPHPVAAPRQRNNEAAHVAVAPREREDEAAHVAIALREREDEPIAIIGIHGSFPHSPDLQTYWEHLRNGRDLIDLVPSDRWDWEEYYHPDPAAVSEGKIYCKWGGFIQDHDKFDPQFFKIPAAEAKLMDPQERLFLESVWAAIEDAGYTRDRLRLRHPKGSSADVGVFVGVTTNSYALWAPEERLRGNFVSPSAMPWSIANRVSYFFDFNGPSLPVDTACSSSLVAIQLACESLRNRESQVAIAGGVNLYLHPAKYQSLCQRRMLSQDGVCHSYGAGDDGFVPGEGVGSLVLKPLSQAVADGDHIYAVIRSGAFDHAGRSNGYSAPNPNAQARLISHTLEKAGIHPDTIGYVEGHGTGTQLGDSLEIAALTKAFREKTDRNQFCAIGCVKANVGHSESAAGMAGLAKVLRQMQHGELVPTIHSEQPNPNIELEQSPFYLQHGLSAWPAPADHPRRALINSFGAGGVNACLVVEEYRTAPKEAPAAGPYLFTLSARDEDRLRQYGDRLLTWLRHEPAVDLADLCYTLQTGREAMEERLAIVAAGGAELITRLDEWLKEGTAAHVHRGSLVPRGGSKRSLKLVRTGVGEQSLDELAAKWAAGEEVDWDSISEGKPRRISAPTYPFARERYWVSDSPPAERTALSVARIHPLIAYNSSTLAEVRFSSSLSAADFYAVDHKVHGEPVFPGAAFLEMACMAGSIAGEQRVRKIRDVVWIQPLGFRSGEQAVHTVLRPAAGGAEYEICSFDDENERVVHSEGKLEFGAALSDVDDQVAVESLNARCTKVESGEDWYERFAALGLHYGPSFRTIEEIRVNDTFALAKLRVPDHLKREFDQFILHPSLIDGALQTIASLAGGLAPRTPYLPFALDELEIIKPLAQSCWVYVERAGGQLPNHAGVTKFNIRLLNERGEVLVRMKNLYVRPLARTLDHELSVAAAEPAMGRLLSLSGAAAE
jgi:polyketide synthase PksL